MVGLAYSLLFAYDENINITARLEEWIDGVLVELKWTDHNLIVDGFEIKENDDGDVLHVSIANLTLFNTVNITIKLPETVH